MDVKKSKTSVVVSGALTCLAAAGIVLVSLFSGGCQDSGGNSQSSGLIAPTAEASSDVMVPALADIEAVIDLAPEQREAFEAALARWRDAASECMARRGEVMKGGSRSGDGPGRWRSGEGGQGDLAEREHPMLGFIEETSDILDAEQFVALLGLLGERVEAHRSALGAAGGAGQRFGEAGGPGHGGFRGKGAGSGEAGGELLEELVDELGLSEEQASQVRDALEKMREAMRALRSQHSPGEGDREELMDKVGEIREQFDEKMKSILEPEQYARLEELRAERRSGMEGRREEREQQRLEHLVEFLTNVLDLNDTQIQQVSAVLTDSADQARANHEKVRNEEISREDAGSEHDRIRDEAMEAIRVLLTPEQAEVFDALKELVPGQGRPFGR